MEETVFGNSSSLERDYEILREAYSDGLLSDWESRFAESIFDRLGRGRDLTGGQQEKVEEIVAKVLRERGS